MLLFLEHSQAGAFGYNVPGTPSIGKGKKKYLSMIIHCGKFFKTSAEHCFGQPSAGRNELAVVSENRWLVFCLWIAYYHLDC